MPSFLDKYAGNGWQQFGRWLVDRLPGNQLAADGTLNNRAVIGGLGAAGLGLGGGVLFGPAGATIGKQVGAWGVNNFLGQQPQSYGADFQFN